METFEQFSFAPEILKAIAQSGYTMPTPIQTQAIPVVLAGQDMMGAAQTGTGKTAAFTLPLIQRLMVHANTSVSPARHPIRALILTPTRELADQVSDSVQKYGQFTPLRSAVVFGGVHIAPQIEQLRKGIEILIATPGRLLDHMSQNAANLSQVQLLVLDEADRMLDMGFLPDLQKIMDSLPQQRQTLLFSATFSPEIKKLANKYLRNPTLVEVARGNATADTVTQKMYAVPADAKTQAVIHLLKTRAEQGLSPQCIVFSNSKLGVARFARHLARAGIKADAIHGDKSQLERMQTLESFKAGEIDVLVATDVAARGLDISDMPCVINADLPFNAEDYVHRIGRTGRAGAQGEAISLITKGDKSDLRLHQDIEKLIKKTLPIEELPGFVAMQPATSPERFTGRGEGMRGDKRSMREDIDPAERQFRQSVRVAKEEGSGHRRKRVEDGKTVRLSNDPFFYQPYEPSNSATVSSQIDEPADRQTNRLVTKGVGALLGGLAKKKKD